MNAVGMFVQMSKPIQPTQEANSNQHSQTLGFLNVIHEQMERLTINNGLSQSILSEVRNTHLSTFEESMFDLFNQDITIENTLGMFHQIELLSQSDITEVDVEQLQLEMTNLIHQVESLLTRLTSKQDVQQIAPKFLELLKNWTALEKQFLQNSQSSLEPKSFHVKLNSVWKEILQLYQNRELLNSKQLYSNESTITTKDIMKWLTNAIQNQQMNESNVPVQHVAYQSNNQLPQIQQYVIYMNQTQNTADVSEQLIKQFQQIMSTSKFYSMPNGMNQLSITLRPEHLGEMMVRLIDINGEMTVKIIVTSQVAKDMLESNISQLRHMFSPQQIVIERQDLGSSANQNNNNQEDGQTEHNDNHHQQNESKQQNENKHDNEFMTHLDQLLEKLEV